MYRLKIRASSPINFSHSVHEFPMKLDILSKIHCEIVQFFW